MCDGYPEDFFAHENQACPPAMSQMDQIKLDEKTTWTCGCLEYMIPSIHKRMLLVLTWKSSSLMEQLSPTCWHLAVRRQSLIMQHRFSCRTSHLSYSVQSVRVDAVWDDYMPDSLKTDTRTKRDICIPRRVDPSSSKPGN